MNNRKIKLYYSENEEVRELFKIEIYRHEQLPFVTRNYVGSVFYLHELDQIGRFYWLLGMIPSRLKTYLSHRLHVQNTGRASLLDTGPSRRRYKSLINKVSDLIDETLGSGDEPVFDHITELYLGKERTYGSLESGQLSTLEENLKMTHYFLNQNYPVLFIHGRVMHQQLYCEDVLRYRALSEDALIAIRFLRDLTKAIRTRYDASYRKLEHEQLFIIKGQIAYESDRINETEIIPNLIM
jgi:hypothetical protein